MGFAKLRRHLPVIAVSDFRNGIHLLKGRAVPLATLWTSSGSWGAHDAATFVAGVGYQLSGSAPASDNIIATPELFSCLDLYRGYLVVTEYTLVSAGAGSLPTMKTELCKLSDLTATSWEEGIDSIFGEFAFAGRQRAKRPMLLGSHKRATLMSPSRAAVSVDGAPPLVADGISNPTADFFGIKLAIVGSSGLSTATLTKITLYDAAAIRSPDYLASLSVGAPLSAGVVATATLLLGALSLSATDFIPSTSASGTIIGATLGSVIVASGLPTGLTIDGVARTWSWDGTGTASTGLLTLTETLAGYGNSPRANAIGYAIQGPLAAPTFLAYSGSGSTSLVGSYGLTETGVPDPAQFWFAFGSDVGEGDIVEFQIDTANTYDTGNLRTESRVLLWDGTLNGGAGGFEFADPDTDVPGDFTIQTGLTPSTTYKMRRRIRRDYGDTSIYSAWTPDVTVSVTASGISFAFNAANHATWSSADQLLTNSNKTWSAVTPGANGARSSIRSTLSITGNGTKVFFEFDIGSWDAAGSNGELGVCTDTYGGAAGSLASVGDCEGNLNQTASVRGAGADVFAANAYVSTLASTGIQQAHRIGIAISVGASSSLMWVLKDGVCHHGTPGTSGGISIPFTTMKAYAALNPNGGTTQTVTITSLAQATTDCPSGFTPAGS